MPTATPNNTTEAAGGAPAIVVSSTAVGLGVIRSLGRRGVRVIAADYDRTGFGRYSRYAAERVLVPDPLVDESRFVRELTVLAARSGNPVIFPTSDAALSAVARSKDDISEHAIVSTMDWRGVRKAIIKSETYEIARSMGIRVPRTMVARSVDDAVTTAATLGFPLLVKPEQSHLFAIRFRAKMRLVSDEQELREIFRAADDAGIDVMIQEMIPGPDGNGANYNSYVVDGRIVAEFTAAKVRNAPRQLGSPRVAVSQWLPDVAEVGRRTVSAVGVEGFSCTEFKRDARDGEWVLMEVNVRHNLSSALAVAAGVDFPWIDYRYLTTGEVPVPDAFREGLFWIDLAREVKASIRHWPDERYPVVDYVRPHLSPNVYADWDAHDMGPFIHRILGPVIHRGGWTE